VLATKSTTPIKIKIQEVFGKTEQSNYPLNSISTVRTRVLLNTLRSVKLIASIASIRVWWLDLNYPENWAVKTEKPREKHLKLLE
jgi:hypothetical protein